jgi:hypothetical protein
MKDLFQIYLECEGTTYPTQRYYPSKWDTNKTKAQVRKEYSELLRISGNQNSGIQPYVKYEDFINGCTIFPFQLSTELPNKEFRQFTHKRGDVRCYCTFGDGAVVRNITLIALGDYESRYSINILNACVIGNYIHRFFVAELRLINLEV